MSELLNIIALFPFRKLSRSTKTDEETIIEWQSGGYYFELSESDGTITAMCKIGDVYYHWEIIRLEKEDSR